MKNRPGEGRSPLGTSLLVLAADTHKLYIGKGRLADDPWALD